MPQPLPPPALAWDGLANAANLQGLGVRRLSAGSGISQVVLAQAETLAADFLNGGESAKLRGQISYGQMQSLFPPEA